MKEFLQAITDILAVLFGDAPERPRAPRPLPPALPPAGPVPPKADPNEPQDAGEVSNSEDPVVISHEAEPPRDTEGPEFDPVPAPPPPEEVERPDEPLGPGRPNPPAPEYRARYMWCIDNGHGALTAGKRSPVLPDGRQLFEYEFNRDISARIFAELDRIGVAYFNVLPEVETWYYHGSTQGRNMAAVFQRHLIERTGMVNRHLRSKVTGQFFVLRATRMPAILTENGFYNNRFDLELMLTDEFRQTIADAHVAAILEIEENGI